MSWWRRRRSAPIPEVELGETISDEQAVAAARAAVAGTVEISGGPVSVSRRGDTVVVEFGCDLPPGTRGPDYDARVTLDAKTGTVREILGSS